MEPNRTASFPADGTEYRPNESYKHLRFQAVMTSLVIGMGVYLYAVDAPLLARVGITLAVVISVGAFVGQLLMARSKTRKRTAEYQKANPSVRMYREGEPREGYPDVNTPHGP